LRCDIQASGARPSGDVQVPGSATEATISGLKNAPPNWPVTLDPGEAARITQEEGIPIVWVPNSSIVTELTAASDRDARIAILVQRTHTILADCRRVLADLNSVRLGGLTDLAGRALDAGQAGHGEAAQALAVVVTESAIVGETGWESYRAAIEATAIDDPASLPFAEVRLRLALAPISRFFTPWYKTSSVPPPVGLSRHAAVHAADAGCYTPANSVISAMLMTSVLRALHELET
jgi:hypothetical protein